MRCPTCGHQNRETAKFCEECAAPVKHLCTRCGSELRASAKFCDECGASVQEPGVPAADVKLEAQTLAPNARHAGERRQLTVLFCDLVGSTAISARSDPEEWRAVLVDYHRAAREVVARFGGHVAKNLGDGFLAYFGWPTAHEDDAERAARAGLGIVDRVTGLGVRGVGDRTPTLTPNPLLQVRVGIDTGPVVVADEGEVYGDTVNVAARVQGLAAPDTVLMTAATHRLVSGLFIVEARGPQALKGVPAPVELYRIVQPSGVRSRFDVAAGRLTRFVGREVELATLVDRWERAQDGEGQNVVVLGEAGVGKSRLVYQLHEHLAAVPHTWLECGASPYTEGTPFHPVIALVTQGLAFTSTDTPTEKVEKIERGLRELASLENVALLADFLGLLPPTPFTMNPDVQRRKTMELLAQWNLAISTIQPLVLLVEDLHWCDASSLELLGRIIAQSATAAVLFVATARPEFTAPWPARSNLTTLQLARLTRQQAREMVTTLVGETLPAETLEALVVRADGVPLYVEELTKAVAEPGAARGADAIPTTLAGSLMARLDRLSAAKEVAQRAAVLGREFPYALLAAVAEMDEAGLRQGLARLVAAEILFVRGEPPSATYTFKHALVQEAAYGSLLKRTRQQFHGRLVDVLVERFPERVAAEPEVVATHAEAAGRSDDAITYYGRAGEQAQARSAYEEAVAQLRKAITLLETRPAGAERDARELNLQIALGASLIAARGYGRPETDAAYERATALAAASNDARQLGVARNGLAVCYYTRGEVERGRVLAAEVLAAADARGDRELVLMANSNIAVPEHFQGKFASSLGHCERAIDLYDPVPDHGLTRAFSLDQGVSALIWAAHDLWCLGRPDAALTRARDAVELARRMDHPFSLASAQFSEMAIHALRREVPAWRECAAKVIALSETQGFPLWLGVGRAYHGEARVAAGEHAALPEIMDGLALAAGTGNQLGAPALVFLLAEAQFATGQLAEAQGSVATSLAIAAQTGQHYFDADLHRLDGDLLLATGGAADEAAARYHRALAIARQQGARSLELRAATSLARLLRDQGKRAEARALLAPIYEWFTEGFDTGDLIAAKALLDGLPG